MKRGREKQKSNMNLLILIDLFNIFVTNPLKLKGANMKQYFFRGIIVSLMAVLNIGIMLGQGLYWESTITAKMEDMKEIHHKSAYRPHMFKQWSENEATIFRLDKELIFSIDYTKKEYSEMTFSEMEAMTKKASSEMDTQMAELKKQLAEMPAEQREAMEKMMGGMMKGGGEVAQLDVSKTGETKTISGYKCTKYLIKENGKEFGILWTTTNVPDFGAMQNDFKAFSQRMASLTTMRGAQMATAMKKIDGFPIQTTIAGMTMTVTKVEKRSVAASDFDVPTGYKKVKPENFIEKKAGKKQKSDAEQE